MSSPTGVDVEVQKRDSALTAIGVGNTVVPASELDAARRQIAELQRLLGKKTPEAEIFREAMEIARDRKWFARSPLLPGEKDRRRQSVMPWVWRARMFMRRAIGLPIGRTCVVGGVRNKMMSWLSSLKTRSRICRATAIDALANSSIGDETPVACLE